MLRVLVFIFIMLLSLQTKAKVRVQSAKAVIQRTVGKSFAKKVQLKLNRDNKNFFSYYIAGNKIYIEVNSAVAIIQDFYDYLKTSGQGLVTWSGKNLNLQNHLVPTSKHTFSPFEYTYYMNMVTHGYTIFNFLYSDTQMLFVQNYFKAVSSTKSQIIKLF